MLSILSRLSCPINARELARELGKPYGTIRKLLQRMAGDGQVISSSAGWLVVSRVSRPHGTDGTDGTRESQGTDETTLSMEDFERLMKVGR
jgi:hypothetical protein